MKRSAFQIFIPIFLLCLSVSAFGQTGPHCPSLLDYLKNPFKAHRDSKVYKAKLSELDAEWVKRLSGYDEIQKRFSKMNIQKSQWKFNMQLNLNAESIKETHGINGFKRGEEIFQSDAPNGYAEKFNSLSESDKELLKKIISRKVIEFKIIEHDRGMVLHDYEMGQVEGSIYRVYIESLKLKLLNKSLSSLDKKILQIDLKNFEKKIEDLKAKELTLQKKFLTLFEEVINLAKVVDRWEKINAELDAIINSREKEKKSS